MKRVLIFLLVMAAVGHAAPRKARHVSRPDPTETAARALFELSDLAQARSSAQQAAARSPRELRALFIEMEAAALEADQPAALEAAVRLCEARRSDPRANIAGARLLELAGNTAEFRAAVPRLRRLLAAESPQSPYIRAALLAAALDGVPGLEPAALAADAGIITRWRVNGPFGELPNVHWEQRWEPEMKPLAGSYSGRATEEFAFLDGNVALPGYLHERDGVFYAESLVETGAVEATLRLESAGTAQIFVDGQSVLAKDDRLRTSSQVQHVTLRLAAGTHRVLVKFLPSAEPWRVAVLPLPTSLPARVAPRAPEAEQRYVRAAERYWSGDFAGAIAALPGAGGAVEEFLLGRAYGAQPAEAAAHFRAALERAPAALAAVYALAAYDLENGRLEDAAAAATRVAAERPSFAPALELLGEAADRLGWDRKALEAYEQRIELRPSCDVLLKAARLFAKSARYDRARAMEEAARDCAPGSLAYAGALSERGEHASAAEAARQVLERSPLDRDALAFLARELRLAGDAGGAFAASAELARVAPNRRERPTRDEDFYLPYRRDGLALARATAPRKFSGGPVVEVLSDKAVRLNTDGSLDEYVHKLTRVLNKEGIERYGEVAVPAGAELLELRTIKPDGRIFEPELHEYKQTISMPALAAEDVIELEYVQHRPSADALAEYPESFRAVFGSFKAPILYARFVAEVPITRTVRIEDAENTRTRVSQREAFTVRSWEANDLPQSIAEPAMPAGPNLPAVALLPRYAGWEAVRDRYRELAMPAAQASPALMAVARQFRGTDEQRARQIAAYVRKTVGTSDGNAFVEGNVAGGEESLAAGEGSRTAAALALANAAGVEARLLLARRPGGSDALAVTSYRRPLVEFMVPGGARVVDVESEGLAFGELPPEVLPGKALEVPLRRSSAREPLIALSRPTEREENFADADLQVDSAGDAWIRLRIRLGSYRSAQMRTTLRGLGAAQRQQLFEQVAMRVFPGATEVSGTTDAEDDLEQALALDLRCRVAHLLDLERLAREGSIDIEQLVPALGLRRMYAGASSRRFPLLVDVPLIETATFRVHLPDGVRVAQNARDVRLTSRFGSYAVEFSRREANTMEIRRSFRIPAQVIEPAAYGMFACFAAQIEDAERQRLSLAQTQAAAPVATVAAR